MKDISTRIAALSPEKRELLLQRLKAAQPGEAGALAGLPLVAPRPEQRRLPFPLTEIQKAYWVGRSDLFDLGSCANVYLEYEIVYRLPRARDMAGWRAAATWLATTFAPRVVDRRVTDLFFDRFHVALRLLIARHDMLRVVMLPGGEQQILDAVPDYHVQVVDLRGRPPRDAEAELDRLRERLRYQKAPIDRWPLFEFAACPLDGQRIKLLVRVDPLIIDGESRGILIAELNQLLLDPNAALPPLECSYRDYALTWEAARASAPYQRAREYWLRQTPSMPPAPELPLARPIDPLVTHRFWVPSVELLDAESWQRLKARAALSHLTPSGVALAAFVEVLTTWSRQQSFTLGLIGTYHPPVHPRIHDVFGNFNTIALLTVDHAPGTFEDRARRLQNRLLADLDHPSFSGHEALRELNRRRGGSTSATIPIFFNSVIDNSQANHPFARYLGARGVELAPTDMFGMTELEVGPYIPQILLMPILREESDGALACKWQVAESLLAPGVAREMLSAYQRLLRRLADEDEVWSASSLALVPTEQLAQRILLNATPVPASPALLHTLVAAQVALRPQQAAVVADGRMLTYADLWRRASCVGRRLRALGARPNTLVAVVMERGWEQVVAVLGVLQSGAAYLPLDPDLPADRLAHALARAEASAALTQSWLDARLSWPAGIERLCIDADVPDDPDQHPFDPVQSEDDLAYVIETAGMTGPPRLVMIDHRAAANTILAINQRFALGPADRILALAPLSSDLAVYDMFGALAAGGTMIIPADADTRDPARLAQALRHEQVTIWNSPPALLELLVTHFAGHGQALPSTLRLALLSRDWAPLSLPDRARALAGDLQVVVLGGCAEAAIWSACHLVGEVSPDWQSIPYGQPLRGQRLHILDEALDPRPVWTPGQLYIAGAGLAQGYWRDVQATAAAFITHPHTGERLFRTGDIARFLPDGTIELLGRDGCSHAEVHGYAIELRRVEAALERRPALRAAIVVARKDQAGRQQLAAYVLPTPASESGESADDEHPAPLPLAGLNGSGRSSPCDDLPDYLLPATITPIAALPLTAQGRVDRRALAAGGALVPPPPAGVVAPRDALERRLAEIWKELLVVSSVSVTDNFFDIGGDSFVAVRLITRVQEVFGPLDRPFTFLYHPTIEYLAKMIRQGGGGIQ